MLKKKILVLCGDRWHPPQVARNGLDALGSAEFIFDFMEDARHWSAEILLNYPCVILTKSDNISATDHTGWMDDSVQAAFAKYVQQGNGLFAIHSGTAEYERKTVLRDLFGGVFVHHPEQCPVTMIPRADHPFCTGIAPWTARDEHYFMALDDPQVDIFMTTTSTHGDQPGAWRRMAGNGRVVVLTPGHNLDVWLNPSFQALLLNALRWCSNRL